MGETRRNRWGRRAGVGGFLLAVLLGLDQLGNVLLGGHQDMTISTRCGIEIQQPREERTAVGRWLCPPVCAALDVLEPNHCIDARE